MKRKIYKNMLIKKEQVEKVQNSDECVVSEYNFCKSNLSLALVNIVGRYPKKGSSVNTECDQIFYCLSGSGLVGLGKEEFKICWGDAIYIDKNINYYLEGNLELVAVNNPAWKLEQYNVINR